MSPSLCGEYLEQDLTRDGAECRDDVGLADLSRQRLCTRRRVGHGERRVAGVHRERAGYDHFAGEVAGLLQYGCDSRPVDRQQQRVRIQGRLARGTSTGMASCLSSESLQLTFAV